MIINEVTEVCALIKNDRIIKTVTLVTFAVAVFIAVLYSVLSAFIVILSYAGGFVLCTFLIKYQTTASLWLQQLATLYHGHFSPNRKTLEKVCSICEGIGCSRHLRNNKAPWKRVHVDRKLNDAVEHFFNRILDQFVLSWYKTYTADRSFICELKHSIRYAMSLAVIRILEVDIGKVVTCKLLPCAIKHVDDYLCMVQIAELKNVDINKIVVNYLGKRLHVAASSRENELKYLRFLSAALIERLLPPDNLKCRNCSVLIREILAGSVFLPLMDVLSDPGIINALVILATTYKARPNPEHVERVELVEFMNSFSQKEFGNSALATDLKSILRTQPLLYAFIQFLKKEDYVHLLNFCLDVEAFNVKLLKPDLSKRQLEELHAEAVNLYKMYLDPKSVDFIGCSAEISDGLSKLLGDGVYNVAKLQTSEPLSQAYDFAFNILEEEWMPQFQHSNEFYHYICGSKVMPTYSKSATTSRKRYNPGSQGGGFDRIKSVLQTKQPVEGAQCPQESRIVDTEIIQAEEVQEVDGHQILRSKRYDAGNQGAVFKISSGFGRIKGALQTKQPIEGALLYPQESRIVDTEITQADDVQKLEGNQTFRDMSTWKVSIPKAETFQYGSKPLHTFNINVQRIDTVQENEIRNWTVQRHEQDFYTLKAKLVEFHGENEICNSPLPSRRAVMPLEMRKFKYEDFLKKLLEKPSLKGSDLLHTFLTAQSEFTVLVTATSMPIVDLENFYQSVASKLRKEKGQHLDAFMNTFLLSTGHQKAEKFEWAEVGEENLSYTSSAEIYPKTMNNSTFNNNFNVTYKRDMESSSSSINPNGIIEAVFYLLKHIFKVPNSILKLYVAICSVAQQAVKSLCRFFIDRKIRAALSQPNLAFLIKHLEDVIFEKHITPTPKELLERKERAFKELRNAMSSVLTSYFAENFKLGAEKLLSILQNPLYNKQLAYSLLDIVVSEIYPELDASEEFY